MACQRRHLVGREARNQYDAELVMGIAGSSGRAAPLVRALSRTQASARTSRRAASKHGRSRSARIWVTITARGRAPGIYMRTRALGPSFPALTRGLRERDGVGFASPGLEGFLEARNSKPRRGLQVCVEPEVTEFVASASVEVS